MKKTAMLAVMALFLGAGANAADKAGAAPDVYAGKAWYDFLFEDPAAVEPVPPQGQQQYYTEPARLVPISGHFTVTADNIMAIKLVSGNGDALISKLTAMGFSAVAHDNLQGGWFLMIDVGATDPAEAALTFLEYKEVSEVWVKRSLYDAIEKGGQRALK